MFERVLLHVTEGTLEGQTFVLENGNSYILGRSGDCSHRFPDAFNMVSRHHCRIKISAPSVSIQDLGSLNGTYVNGVKVGQRSHEQSFEKALQEEQMEYPLWDGDEIRIGCHAFWVELAPRLPCDEVEAGNGEHLQGRFPVAELAASAPLGCLVSHDPTFFGGRDVFA